jgi:solute carrier family 13 (sodium-dependent dicarboxylate transporter), member 2/3/5
VKLKPVQIIPRALAAAGLGFFLVTLFAPAPEGLTLTGWRTLGGAVLMAAFWISEILPFPVTAMLPLVLFPAAGIAPVAAAAAPYANPVIYLFLGGILIALAMESSNLHRRIALRIIGLAGVGRRAVIGGFLMAAFFVSMWVNNTAVSVMMLPIALSVLRLFQQESDHAFAPALLLAVAYGANIGGMTTLVGTAPNAILAGFLLETQGIHLGFLGWMTLALPVSLILALVVWLVLTRLAHRIPADPLPGGRELLDREHEALGPMTHEEKTVTAVFVLTASLWIARGFLEGWFPWLNDTTIAMAGGISLFLLPARRGSPEKILSWTQAQKIPWDVLLLIGGGLSLAAAIQKNGVAEWIGGFASGLEWLPAAGLVFLVVLLIIWLTEITSNSATTSTFLPIAAALAVALGQPPVALAAAVALSSSCAFMLPVATPPNAIVFGSGRVTLHEMMRTGVWLNIFCWLILSSWLAWVAPKLPGLTN